MTDNKDYYHKRGEKDASEGKYNPPHGFIDEATTIHKSGIEKNLMENKAYRDGYENTKSQIKKD